MEKIEMKEEVDVVLINHESFPDKETGKVIKFTKVCAIWRGTMLEGTTTKEVKLGKQVFEIQITANKKGLKVRFR